MTATTDHAPDLRFFDVQVLASDDNDGQRTVSGLAVPYGEDLDRPNWMAGTTLQRFAPGSAVVRDNAQLFYGHDHVDRRTPIGRIVSSEQTDAGLKITATLSRTAKGDEVYTLLKDGVLTQFSIGYHHVTNHIEDADTDAPVLVHDEVDVFETSVVPDPAYKTALIEQVLSASPAATTPDTGDTDMTTTDTLSAEDGRALQTSIDTLAAQVQVLADNGGGQSGPADLGVHSLGEFAKGLLDGSSAPKAEAITLAYEGAVTGDSIVRPAWIDRDVRLVVENRPIFNLFSSERLPSEGNSVEYPEFDSQTGDVATQANEGDDLAYLELKFKTGTAPVLTRGGYSMLTRQVIERSSIPYLNKIIRRQAISYGVASNAAVRGALTSLTNTNTAAISAAARVKGVAWTDTVLEASAAIEGSTAGLTAEFWVMGLTHLKQVLGVTDSTDRPVFALTGDNVNTFGEGSVRALRANIGGMPVFYDPKLTGTASYICSSEALTTMESGPFSLTDENIINLTKAFSVYGYSAITKNEAKGVVKVTHAA